MLPGESIPPFKVRLKFNCEVSFTNMLPHAGLGRDISVPPAVECQKSAWSQNVPEGLKQEVANVVKNTYGSYMSGIKIESYRMCWYVANSMAATAVCNNGMRLFPNGSRNDGSCIG